MRTRPGNAITSFAIATAILGVCGAWFILHLSVSRDESLPVPPDPFALKPPPVPPPQRVRAGVGYVFHGRSVLAMEGLPLAAGAPLTVVVPDLPQTVQKAVVVAPAPDQTVLKFQTAGPYYFVRGDRDQTLPELSVVVIGHVVTKRIADTVSLHVDGAHPDVRVRVCRSTEGLHLTLWAGEPLKSERLTHVYFYVGYDLQPTCTPLDTRLPK